MVDRESQCLTAGEGNEGSNALIGQPPDFYRVGMCVLVQETHGPWGRVLEEVPCPEASSLGN